MNNDLEIFRDEVLLALAEVTDIRAWDAIRVNTLGKSGKLTALLRSLGGMSPEIRKERGQALNRLRDELAHCFEERKRVLEKAAIEARLQAERVDVSLPPPPCLGGERQGFLHPISRTIEEIRSIFGTMGFSVEEGPDIETDWYNFSALNTPDHHPARTDHDTFYLSPRQPTESEQQEIPQKIHLLRTQTSGVQIRTLLAKKPPLRIIAPGRVYRADHDATHSPMFHQCEGLVIEQGITLSHLKGCLTDFLRVFFDRPRLPVRFRASYFPFTEPSLEVDIGWSRQTGEIGNGADWLEVLGAGMVHVRVLANCGLDPREWQGFAFGMGIERLTMLKNGISDVRSFFENDIRWLRYYGTNPFEAVL